MWISDLFHILQDTMGHILGEEREQIAIQCHYEADFATEEHYRLMSILKNLVMNAAEAIQSGRGTGAIWVEEQLVGDDLVFTVQDNGPGISPGPCRICSGWATPPSSTRRRGILAGGSACPLWSSWSKSWAEPFR